MACSRRKQNQKVHARRRAAERFDIKLTRNNLAKIVSDIQKDRAVFVERQSNRVTLFIVTLCNQKIRVAYDSERQTVITVLPLRASDWRLLDEYGERNGMSP